MATTTATLPVCVYCGTARPADQTRCETCDRPWIDVHVGTGTAVPVAAAAGAVVTGGASNGSGTPTSTSPAMPAAAAATTPPLVEEADPEGTWEPPPSRKREWSMWAIPAVLGVAVLAVYALIFFGAFDSGTTETTEAAAETTVATTAGTEATTATTTTAPPTTTTTAPPTTTTTLPPPDPAGFSPAGNPIAPTSLTLKAGGIGPLEIGAPGTDIIGRLVASLGTAEATGFDGIESWVCEGDEGFWVRWSGLTAIFAGGPETGTFVGFRFEEQTSATSHTDLATLSGIRVGDSISDLEAVYSQFKITYDVVEGQAHFSLFDGDELLLWGPVSSMDSTGRIVGIYSPHACTTA